MKEDYYTAKQMTALDDHGASVEEVKEHLKVMDIDNAVRIGIYKLVEVVTVRPRTDNSVDTVPEDEI